MDAVSVWVVLKSDFVGPYIKRDQRDVILQDSYRRSTRFEEAEASDVDQSPLVILLCSSNARDK